MGMTEPGGYAEAYHSKQPCSGVPEKLDACKLTFMLCSTCPMAQHGRSGGPCQQALHSVHRRFLPVTLPGSSTTLHVQPEKAKEAR